MGGEGINAEDKKKRSEHFEDESHENVSGFNASLERKGAKLRNKS
jgi:hypothetical protein